MVAVYILLVLIFSLIVCIIEVPKMLKQGEYGELWAFSVLLAIGTVLSIMKSLNVPIPNPTDFEAWVYSPLQGLMKSLLK